MPEDDRVILCIGDNGPGIPGPDRERIFDPFYTTASDGTGIGLSIVQRIIADHSGTIHVGESPPAGRNSGLNSLADHGAPMNYSLLIIDDEESIRDSLTMALGRHYEVSSCAGARRPLNCCRPWPRTWCCWTSGCPT